MDLHNNANKYDILGYSYAGLVATGGIMGYLKAGSPVSLIAGLLFGSAITYGAYLTSKDPNNCYMIFGTSMALAILMGARFYKSGKFMPAGLITCLSVGMAMRYGYRLLQQHS